MLPLQARETFRKHSTKPLEQVANSSSTFCCPTFPSPPGHSVIYGTAWLAGESGTTESNQGIGSIGKGFGLYPLALPRPFLYTGLFIMSWERFCKMFSESSLGRWAVPQLPCCPSKQGELSENILQNLSHDLMNSPVFLSHNTFFNRSQIPLLSDNCRERGAGVEECKECRIVYFAVVILLTILGNGSVVMSILVRRYRYLHGRFSTAT